MLSKGKPLIRERNDIGCFVSPVDTKLAAKGEAKFVAELRLDHLLLSLGDLLAHGLRGAFQQPPAPLSRPVPHFLLCFLARPEGLEPPAYWFEANRSIQLSYGRARLRTSTWYHPR
jgi:hypothetical protein